MYKRFLRTKRVLGKYNCRLPGPINSKENVPYLFSQRFSHDTAKCSIKLASNGIL